VDSALTSNGDVNKKHDRLKDLPASFVPNRNAMFITIAHALAQKIETNTLVTGVCETDFSGYPDCRADFVAQIQDALNSGSDCSIYIHTPLMYLNKAEIFKMAKDFSILADVLKLSHTCYNGDRTKRHPWGYGCNDCAACKLRRQGYEQYLQTYKEK